MQVKGARLYEIADVLTSFHKREEAVLSVVLMTNTAQLVWE